MTKHTPGPWRMIRDDPGYGTVFSYEIWAEQYRAKGANLIGTITGRGCLADRVVEANARLIAAAPELLKACRIALDALGCDRVRQERLEAQKIIHAAIAKAKADTA